MSPRYKEALVEVQYIINKLEPQEREKIPQKFLEFIEQNKDKRYKMLDDGSLKEETLAFLAIIYRKYLAPKEERKNLEKKYQEKLKQEKAEIRNNRSNAEISYVPKVINQDNISNLETKTSVIAISNYTKKKWYDKFLDGIKNILRLSM